jgi:hypothetical protein
MNAYLKEIADLCGINKNLTFHIARHTFATTGTLSNGVPIETVSKMLGHKNLRTMRKNQLYNFSVGSHAAHVQNVGIGTIRPAAKLEVSSVGAIRSIQKVSGGNCPTRPASQSVKDVPFANYPDWKNCRSGVLF